MLSENEAREAARLGGRYWAARRQIVRSTCAYCGRGFEGTKKRRYCSSAHRVADFRRRKREAEHAAEQVRE